MLNCSIPTWCLFRIICPSEACAWYEIQSSLLNNPIEKVYGGYLRCDEKLAIHANWRNSFIVHYNKRSVHPVCRKHGRLLLVHHERNNIMFPPSYVTHQVHTCSTDTGVVLPGFLLVKLLHHLLPWSWRMYESANIGARVSSEPVIFFSFL